MSDSIIGDPGEPGDEGLVPADEFWRAQHEAGQRDLEEHGARRESDELADDGNGWFVFRDSQVDLREPSLPHVTRVLVANRGEIARRVFRTAKIMGYETVAVFSDPDRNSAHVRDADVAAALGGTTSAESYLDTAKILDAAVRTGADAIHPGYGFLSENPDFAEAVTNAGLVWVGPTPESIRAMALKVEAKRLAESAGVPLVPGAEIAADASDSELLATAKRIGFPVLVKASAGGGGKGMRTVVSAGDLVDAVAGARREAQASFGDPTVFFERYLLGARHVEVQVFGDTHGNVVHFFERECSIQRRHQKIIEESPSPGATTRTLDQMYAASVSLAKAINYVGAGTVEFLVAGDGAEQEFFFLEMNTRLQVEHAVTECVVLGLDLVRWQLLVAQGVALPTGQNEIVRDGHAIEARLYAEDPARQYLPSTGTAVAFQSLPQSENNRAEMWQVRDELSIESGDEVSPFYDPMVGKVIGRGSTRRATARNLAANLRQRDIAGITTNREALVQILESEAFLAGETATDFLDVNPELLRAEIDAELRERHLTAATVAHAHSQRHDSGWGSIAPIGWRNIPAVPQRTSWEFIESGRTRTVSVLVDWEGHDAGRIALVEHDGSNDSSIGRSGKVDGRTFSFTVAESFDPSQPCDFEVSLRLDVDGLSRRPVRVASRGEWTWVNDTKVATAYRRLPRFAHVVSDALGGGLSAPVPGTVVAVEVAAGQAVSEGQTLVVLEAMKMEHQIRADSDSFVAEVLVSVGDVVDAHQVLVTLESTDPSGAAS